MSKRAPQFERAPRDFYPTPYEAVVPLLAHLVPGTRFCEPCAGDGALINYLIGAGFSCVYAFDIEPRTQMADQGDARTMQVPDRLDCFITNPPWRRDILHPIIQNLSDQAPTWLLFDADWKHTKQAAPFMPLLRKIVSVGRVKWIPDSPFTGKDNCCWYLFDAHSDAPAQFVGRLAA